MEPASLVKSVTLEDGASPRSARYMIRLRQLTEGYVVETVWGGSVAVRTQKAISAQRWLQRRKSLRKYLRPKQQGDVQADVIMKLPQIVSNCCF